MNQINLKQPYYKKPTFYLGVCFGIVIMLIIQSARFGSLNSLWNQFNFQVIHRARYLELKEQLHNECLSRTERVYKEMGLDTNNLSATDYKAYLDYKKSNDQGCDNAYKNF